MEHHTFPVSDIPEAYGPYSHVVVAGDFVFISGQIARDAKTGTLISAGIGPQTTRCLEIVRDILAKCGLTLRDVVRVTVYLKDISDFEEMNRAYVAAFTAPFPARSTPQVGLPFGALVGVEVTAYQAKTNTRS
jgi:2-iminobutanoate/2-iminopropanoate deaminase